MCQGKGDCGSKPKCTACAERVRAVIKAKLRKRLKPKGGEAADRTYNAKG
jgi:hypothetical protein